MSLATNVSAAVLRAALRLPSTYRVTAMIEAPVNASATKGRSESRTLYRLHSPTAGVVPVFAAVMEDAGVVEITDSMFAEIITKQFAA